MNPTELASLKSFLREVIAHSTAEYQRSERLIEAEHPNTDWGSENENLGYYYARIELAQQILEAIANGTHSTD